MTEPVPIEPAQALIGAASSLFARLEGLPTAAHPDVYDDVHRCLQEALANTDAR